MGKIYTIDEIRERVKPVAERYGIDRVWLFGSYARGEATEDSDVDLLIHRKNTMSMFELGGVYEDLTDVLLKNIDLLTESSLYHNINMPHNKNLRYHIEKERVMIYE